MNPLSVATKFCHDTQTLKYRTVVDFSRHLNPQFREFKTTLDDFKTIIPRLSQNAYMCSFDLEAAYHHIKLNSDFIEFCGFALENESGVVEFYVFLYLPFGLQPAAFCMNNCTRPIMTYCHDLSICCSIYLDDLFNSDVSQDKCFVSYMFIIFIFKCAGWTINYNKSSTKPLTFLKYLGFYINTRVMQIRVASSKLDTVKRLIHDIIAQSLLPESIHCRKFAEMLGIKQIN